MEMCVKWLHYKPGVQIGSWGEWRQKKVPNPLTNTNLPLSLQQPIFWQHYSRPQFHDLLEQLIKKSPKENTKGWQKG